MASNCYCGRPIMKINADYNRIEDLYCSTYCRRYKEEGFVPVKRSDSKYHKNTKIKPPIPANCDYCGDSYNITYELKKSNREFCSLPCYHSVKRGRRTFIHYTILRILRHKGEMIVSDIAPIISRFGFKAHPSTIAHHLRLLVGRGIVLKKHRKGKNPQSYKLNPAIADKPIGKLIVDKVRIND